MKLDFPSLNGLLHCVLTYLRGEIALVPGAASIPEGTSIELNLTYPDADEPVVVRGVSQGLDPAGRGLRLKLDNPQEVDQVTMLLGHLHLGPYAARKLLAFVRAQQGNKPRLLTRAQPAETAEVPDAGVEAAPEIRRSGGLQSRAPRSLHSEEDRVLLDKASAGARAAKSKVPSPRISPPRMRPPSVAQTSTSLPTQRTQVPGGGGRTTRTKLPQPPVERPARPPQPAAPARRRPPISSDRMPGLPKARPRQAPPVPAQQPAAPPVTGDGLNQTQMVRLEDMNADLGSTDDY